MINVLDYIDGLDESDETRLSGVDMVIPAVDVMTFRSGKPNLSNVEMQMQECDGHLIKLRRHLIDLVESAGGNSAEMLRLLDIYAGELYRLGALTIVNESFQDKD